MMQRVQRSEASEADSKSELSELLSAHDKLQDKWREASRTMAAQSQRHITDLREQVGRLDVCVCMYNTYVLSLALSLSLSLSLTHTHTHTHCYIYRLGGWRRGTGS
jgi:hypothetical protein